APAGPPAPPAPPEPSEPVSELATGEVPAVSVEPAPAVVDELFARIRADQERPEGDESRPDQRQAPAPVPTSPAVDPVTSEHALENRDDLLDNIEASLARALKRVLQDEQNEVLDALRRAGNSSPVTVLPAPDVQLASYRDAALPWLRQAAVAGAGFVSEGSPRPFPGGDAVAVDGQALALARDLVDPLRERLTRALDASTEADESIRATYRQWKVQHVEASARHHALAAFNVGAFAATPDGAALQWLVDDDGHCPDCDDNALAGPTPKGQPFPTGQLHPPAHPGCRCLLAPVST
ncbi:MAG: hypothetical protein M3203_16795, partial [Actinomycetota bacterium]|nr:hypothetical protein [Actinomycetota bacterium]